MNTSIAEALLAAVDRLRQINNLPGYLEPQAIAGRFFLAYPASHPLWAEVRAIISPAPPFEISCTGVELTVEKKTAPADQKHWIFRVEDGLVTIKLLNDAGTACETLYLHRTGAAFAGLERYDGGGASLG